MPTNRIIINEVPLLVWEVGDSKMPEVVDLLNKVGLIDVFARFGVANLTTEIAIDFYDVDGSAAGDPFTGLLLGDFTVFNENTALAVVPSASVEAPNGTYTLTIAAQTTGDILTVTATQAGFDFSQTTNEKITAL